MKIVFDFNPVVKNRYSGFYTFGANLIRAFDDCPEPDLELKLFYSRRFEAAADNALAGLKSGNIARVPTVFSMNKLKKIWSLCRFPSLEFLAGEFDVFHSFHNMMPPCKGKPRILTVHDLRRYRLPELYSKPHQPVFEKAVNEADHIIAVSESTKKDIVEFFEVDPQKISAVHLAGGGRPEPLSAEVREQYRQRLFADLGLEPGRYLVTVSSPDSRKNILNTLKAFISAQQEVPDLRLVIAGKMPRDERERREIEELTDANPAVVATGPVDNLEKMIAASDGLLFLSFYEGFGIPMLDALAAGIPVLGANCSSLPEVGGDVALYADPRELDSMIAGIVELSGVEVESFRLRAVRRAESFSWRKTAKGIIDIYRSLS